MRLDKAWLVATKDFEIFRTKRNILFSIISFELFMAVVLPFIAHYAAGRSPRPATVLPPLIDAFSFWFVIGSAILPIGIASYSLVGEKVQHSLEPLLASPVTDNEILAGKGIAAFLPTLVATYAGAITFMVLIDILSHGALRRLYYPNWTFGLLLLICPLVTIFSVEANILVSSRVTDVRAAQQLGAVPIIPLGAIYLLLELKLVSLTITHLLVFALILFVIDRLVFTLVLRTFKRDEILTVWK